MKRIQLESSIISAVGYDGNTRILEVEFKKNGQVKQYMNVDEVTYNHFISCTSIGQFYLIYINGFYEEREI